MQEWIDTVRSAAIPHWDLDDPVDSEVAVTITYFFDGAALDVDNIPKPILDALKGVEYFDDSQVFDLVCRKRDTTLTLEIPDPSPVLRESLEGFGQFLHISVTYALTNEVVW